MSTWRRKEATETRGTRVFQTEAEEGLLDAQVGTGKTYQTYINCQFGHNILQDIA